MILVELLCPSVRHFDTQRVIEALRNFFGGLPAELGVDVSRIQFSEKHVGACDKVGGAIRLASCDADDREMAMALVSVLRVTGMQYVYCPLRLDEGALTQYWQERFELTDLRYVVRALSQEMLANAGVAGNPLLV